MKILESPKLVIGVTFVVALVIGILVYIFVGYAPKIEKGDQSVSILNSQWSSGDTIDLAFLKSGRVSAVLVKQGDVVKKGQTLANLDFADVSGALEIAKANYQKLLNGATSADIDVAKSTIETAQVNLDTVTKQQNLAVQLAYSNLLNSTLEAIPDNGTNDYAPPTISGTYLLGEEGTINLELYYSSGGVSFNASGLTDGTGICNAIIPQPIGDSGLYIKFPSSTSFDQKNWVINIPDKKAPNYLVNYNAYQSALDAQKRLIAVAQASLDQANSALALKVANARPEDIASAEGALQIAESAYQNDFIYAPVDGTIMAVNLNVGAIAQVNSRVISMIAK